MKSKKSIIIFVILITIFSRHIFTNTNEINFNISDFSIDLSIQNEIIYDKVNEYNILNSVYFQNLKLPSIHELNISDNNFYPQELTILEIEKVLIKENLDLNTSYETDFKRIEYNNKPITLSSYGKKREQSVFIINSTPFLIEENNLYFTKKIIYELNSFKTFEKISNRNIEPNKKIDLLIITSNQFQQSFERYKLFKEKQGVSTKISYIEEDIYPQIVGITDFEKVRNYIKKEYLETDINSVLLGGGAEIIPIAELLPYVNEVVLPSDVYYSNLDGEMDSNGNGTYGEVSDNIDVYADITIGRFPVNTVEDLEAIINKSIKYYTGDEEVYSANQNYYNSLFFWAFEVFNPSVGIQICESIKNILPETLVIDSLYENISPNFNFSTALSMFNKGHNIIYVQSHGAVNKIGSPEGWGLYSDHLANLDHFSGLYFIASCYPGNFKYNSLSQKSMNASTGGCMNYIGSSVSEYPTISAAMNKFFFINFYNNDLNDIGTNLANAKLSGFLNLSGPSYTRFLNFAYTLLGDPTNLFFTEIPNETQIETISEINTGSSTITGVFENYYDKSIIVSLISNEGELITTTTTNSNEFTLTYSNLYSDSIIISYYAKNIFLKDEKFATSNDNDLELEFYNLEINDSNQSSVIENNENFNILLDISTISNISSYDSLKLTLMNYDSTFFNIPLESRVKKVKIPDIGHHENFELNNLLFNYENLLSDTTLSISLKAETMIPISNNSVNRKIRSEEIFYSEILIPVSNPKLELNYVNYINDDNDVTITLTNKYNGKIDSAKIRLIEDKDKKTNEYRNQVVTLKNIEGNLTFSDSIIFSIEDNTLFYQIGILLNDTPSEDEYLSELFTKDTTHIANFNMSYKFEKNDMISLNFEYNNSDYDNFNIYLFENDTTSTDYRKLLNFEKINEDIFQFHNNFDGEKYVKISVISDSFDESHFSRFFKLNNITSYEDSPYTLSNYEIFNPLFDEDENKIIASSTTSSVYGLNYDGNLINNSSILYDSFNLLGISPAEAQGTVIGDVNNDGFDDIVNYNYSMTTGDSITINLIDTHNNLLLAQKKLYGFIFFNAPVLINYDEDNELEIMVPVFNGNIDNGPNGKPKGAYIYLLDYNEQTSNLDIIDPFPIVSSHGSFHVHSPTIYDLNNDGVNELIFNSGKRIEIYRTDTFDKIESEYLESNLNGPISICDVNNNGIVEIYASTKNSKLFAFELDASDTLYSLVNWEGGKQIEMNPIDHLKHYPPSAFFADINNDEIIEIINVTGKEIAVFDVNGNIYNPSIFPIQLDDEIAENNITNPSMADFNGDGILDFLFADSNAKIWCYSGNDGTVLEGFPVTVPSLYRKYLGNIPIADLDNDGDLEFAIGNNYGELYIYDYGKQTSDRKIYDTFRGDKYNSGVYLREDLLVNIENFDNDNTILDKNISILNHYPNPFNPSIKIKFFIKNSGNLKFKVFNVKGEIVFESLKEYEKSGNKAINFNAQNLVSGTYIYTLEFAGEIISNKCLLIK